MHADEIMAIEEMLKAAVDGTIAKDIRGYARHTNWAGDIGFECDTYQALARLKPELRPLTPLGLAKVFRLGRIFETPNLQLLQNSGLKIVEQARPYAWKEKEISGRIDAKIELEADGRLQKVPLEHKTCSPDSFRTIARHKADGIPLWFSKHHWVRKYPGQLQIYELMDAEDLGVWMFFNKVNGDYFFWIQQLNYEYVETLIQRAERTNENVAANRVPAPVTKELCEDCDFHDTYCFPEKDRGEGFDFITSEELIAKLDRLDEIKPIAKEKEEIWEELAEMFRGRSAIVGDRWKIESTAYTQKRVIVPDELKIKFTREFENFRLSVKPLKK